MKIFYINLKNNILKNHNTLFNMMNKRFKHVQIFIHENISPYMAINHIPYVKQTTQGRGPTVVKI